MKFLLVALNAKYIHSNPALYSLRAYAGEQLQEHVEIAEYTINQSLTDILADIYKRKPEVIGLSCYIWNIERMLDLVKELRPDIKLGVEIKEYTEENVDITIKALKEYGIFERCWFYAFNGRIIRYIKEKYNGRTMGYPDFQMGEFENYDFYDEIGLNMSLVKSELCEFYVKKGLPVHMYCADNEADVKLCIERGADLITANDPRDLLKVLGK